MKRKIVHIDEEKCNGCGQCVPACAEGAIQIIDGKARLVSDSYCDGLGACLGECPQGAITVIEREAAEFDSQAVQEHLASPEPAGAALPCGCPGTMARRLSLPAGEPAGEEPAAERSELTHWPVQLALVPPTAPYLQDADVLVCADCVAFALPGFHRRLLRGRAVVVACPKLDDAAAHAARLAAILRANRIRSITVAHMEVPCCAALERIVDDARTQAGSHVAVSVVNVGVDGRLEQACPVGSEAANRPQLQKRTERTAS